MSTSKIKYVRHGMYGTRPYNIWSGIKRRCYNKNDISYVKYGSKGIVMSEEWRESFMGFWKDMEESYFDEATIDRIDNNKGYSKENCRWATVKEQANNKKSVKLYTYKGRTMNTMDWAKEFGIKPGTLRARLKRYNWSLEDALAKEVDYANTLSQKHGKH